MTTWFTADLHLGHKNIINYCDRPWAKDQRNPTQAEAIQMSKDLVKNWNDVVKPEDIVYNLGDLAHCFSVKGAAPFVWALNGKHHFIRGNHDKDVADVLSRRNPSPFASYTPGYLEVEVEGQMIVMCHFAFREWHHASRGVWHVFGHNHSTLGPFGKSVDVGVDNASQVALGAFYRPISFAELKFYMDKRPLGSHPKFEHYHPGHPEIKHLEKGK